MEHHKTEKTLAHPRSEKEKEQMVNRLKRIEGQVRGIQKMIEDDRYCVDILVQMSAIDAALKKVSLNLLKRHTSHCVVDAVNNGKSEEAVDELMDVFERFSKI
ncbi:metal-sensing transcriptional repressor [Halalkalibacterium ligniniphilum]|uniref:metal-sensing transcriptional repressor n=1 Tax=Halalkalibacterium ligniniphilum TaxID=1134413 RepID=UPI000346695C|nr:metal-sensing transcriptional repressor [Halalkalibacterium ligniniphilum]